MCIRDSLNNYLVETSQVLGIDSYENISGPGMQHLDGLHALSYCRIRYTTGDDFKRTERQRAVLQQLFEKAKTMDILTLNNLADELLDMCAVSYTHLDVYKRQVIRISLMRGENTGILCTSRTGHMICF